MLPVDTVSTPAVPTESREATAPAAMNRRERLFAGLVERSGVPCELALPGGRVARFGAEAPRFRVVVRSERALRRLDELSLGRAYVEGDLDLEGDLLALFEVREALTAGVPLAERLRFLGQLFLLPATWVNRRAIDHHYTLGDDFYLSFIDSRYRFYSHCLFQSAEETLEEAAEHKLETMVRCLGLSPGMRLLDIGGGWGAVAQYCGARGIHVTSVTLADDSRRYIEHLIRERDLPAEVVLTDFLDYRPEEPFDAAVIYGVIEHIPDYGAFCARAWECIKPGGGLYMDASASIEKYEMSAFTRRYIWHGTHTFLAVQDVIQELLFHGFELSEVVDETADYERTIRAWAERLDERAGFIAERWGEEVYRAFRIYLWGGCHAFRVGRLQAYHLVARRRETPGPRPGLARRARSFLRSLA